VAAGHRSTTATRDRRLRRTVLRLRGCLGALPADERRVLELRAGIGAAQPRPRRTVARITGFGETRVGRLERAGLRRLDTLRCAGAPPSRLTAGVPVVAGTAGTAGTARTAGNAALVAATTTHRTPRSAVRGEQSTHHGKAKGGTPAVSLLPPTLRPGGAADQTGVLFALIALAGSGYALFRWRRGRSTSE
jgi:hypothetical protein